MPIYIVQVWHANNADSCFSSSLTGSIGMTLDHFVASYTLRKEVEVEAADVSGALNSVIPRHLSATPEPQVGIKVVHWVDSRDTQEGDILVVVDAATKEIKGYFFLKGRGEHVVVQLLQGPSVSAH